MVALAQILADAKAAGWGEWIRSEADERALLEGCTFDISAAQRVRDFFGKFLRHSKGQWAKQPFELLDWQWQSVVAPLFGWKRADGTPPFPPRLHRGAEEEWQIADVLGLEPVSVVRGPGTRCRGL